MTPRQSNTTCLWLWLAFFAAVAMVALTSGCGLQKLIQDGVDASVKIRPGGKNPDMQPPPAPPAPQPPDDWAPPWFRRPKPEQKKSAAAQWQEKQLARLQPSWRNCWLIPPFCDPKDYHDARRANETP